MATTLNELREAKEEKVIPQNNLEKLVEELLESNRRNEIKIESLQRSNEILTKTIHEEVRVISDMSVGILKRLDKKVQEDFDKEIRIVKDSLADVGIKTGNYYRENINFIKNTHYINLTAIAISIFYMSGLFNIVKGMILK